ncbi:MAG: DUF4332 domain-containing protein [Chloroflexota bacterium]|nr:MAG: DUF4332 domain-containing protein [Chloroflexota bacterium]
MTKLADIEGIGGVNVDKLKKLGILSLEDLLSAGCSPEGRKSIAGRTGISDKSLLEWVNHADLFRIKGVGQEYADLLEEAGVDTVVELAQRSPANLMVKMAEVQTVKKLVRKLPAQSQVENWIHQARQLPRVITY